MITIPNKEVLLIIILVIIILFMIFWFICYKKWQSDTKKIIESFKFINSLT